MNMLKEERPLIEWEKELDVWLVDLLPNEHYEKYTKMDAFSKIGIANFRRNWGVFEKEFYNSYKNKNYLFNSVCSNVVIDNRRRPLIEWEKKFGYWFTCLSFNDHLKKCSREEAFNMLNYNYFRRSWDEDADKLYMDYLDSSSVIKNEEIGVKNLKFVDTTSCLTSDESRKILLKKIPDIKQIFKRKTLDRIIKVNKFKNKVRVRDGFLKKVLAVTLSLVTAATAYGFTKIKHNYDDIKQELVNSDNVNYNVDELYNIDSFIKDDDVLDLKKANKYDNIVVNDKHAEEINIVNNDSLDIKKKSIDKINNEDKKEDKVGAVKNDIEIGDVITLKKGSYVYDNMYNAIDKTYGYDTYYSYDTCRDVNYIVLSYNDEFIFSDDLIEIENYKSHGAKVVSVCTDDGFYNSNDVVVKVKKHKM